MPNLRSKGELWNVCVQEDTVDQAMLQECESGSTCRILGILLEVGQTIVRL